MSPVPSLFHEYSRFTLVKDFTLTYLYSHFIDSLSSPRPQRRHLFSISGVRRCSLLEKFKPLLTLPRTLVSLAATQANRERERKKQTSPLYPRFLFCATGSTLILPEKS